MSDLATLRSQLDALRAMRVEGIREMQFNGRRVVYRSDAELASAIGDVERQIAFAEGRRRGSFVPHYSKGTL